MLLKHRFLFLNCHSHDTEKRQNSSGSPLGWTRSTKTLNSVGKILHVVPTFKANYGIFVLGMYFIQTSFGFFLKGDFFKYQPKSVVVPSSSSKRYITDHFSEIIKD